MLYGATPIEDIIGYNQIVRSITEWTNTNQECTISQQSINEGIGGYIQGRSGLISSSGADSVGSGQTALVPGLVNVRQAYIHGISTQNPGSQVVQQFQNATQAFGVVPAGNPQNPITIAAAPGNADLIKSTNPRKRYQIQFALGLFNQSKLIPTKFMASQLAIEITLANPSECIFQSIYSPAVTTTPNATYQVTNVNLIPEILEFDASYDEMFLKGLMNGGVPIKFATWNNYKSVTGGASSVNIQIQERGRSVKSIYALQRRDPTTFNTDSGATFFCSGSVAGGTLGNGGFVTLQEYQYRIGGR